MEEKTEQGLRDILITVKETSRWHRKTMIWVIFAQLVISGIGAFGVQYVLFRLEGDLNSNLQQRDFQRQLFAERVDQFRDFGDSVSAYIDLSSVITKREFWLEENSKHLDRDSLEFADGTSWHECRRIAQALREEIYTMRTPATSAFMVDLFFREPSVASSTKSFLEIFDYWQASPNQKTFKKREILVEEAINKVRREMAESLLNYTLYGLSASENSP